jgi:hypothetical protein
MNRKFPGVPRLAILLTWVVAGIAFNPVQTTHAAAGSAGSPSSGVSLRWVPDSSDTNRSILEVTGLNEATLKQLRRTDWKPAQWQQLLAVRAEQGDLLADIGLPPMLGTYRVTADSLRFEPQFPLEPGVTYRATLQSGQLPGGKKSGARPLTTVLQFPRKTEPTTVVTQIFPSADVLPENLLKFYVHFSASMSGGHIYEHIHLLNEAGQPVELPFLEIDEELWNPEMTRLTLFIDPGRIKRGVKPLEEIGPALEAGKRFTLIIDQAWKDSAGLRLKQDFQKKFLVGPSDREPPNPARWKIVAPKAGTTATLAVQFEKPMDHALAQRMIQVTPTAGNQTKGKVTLEDGERRWVFHPVEAWRPGSYKLAVQTTIEDQAGNNIGKPFEVDVFDGVQRRLTNSTVTVAFEVQ